MNWKRRRAGEALVDTPSSRAEEREGTRPASPACAACPQEAAVSSGRGGNRVPRPGERPLPDYPGGTLLRITGLAGGRTARCRLCALGLVPGTPVRLTSGGNGAVTVSVRDAEIVLGRGLAEKVYAMPDSGRPD